MDELIKENPKKFSLNKGRYQPRYENELECCIAYVLFHPFICLAYMTFVVFLGLIRMPVTPQEFREEVFEITRKRKILMHCQVWPKMEEVVSPSKVVDRTTLVENLFLREMLTSPI